MRRKVPEKYSFRLVILMFLLLIAITVFPVSVSAGSRTIVMQKGRTYYSVDLNGGGNENIRYTTATRYNEGILIYVNGKSVYYDKYLPIYRVSVVDINSSDRYKEILLEYDWGSLTQFRVLRYGSDGKIHLLYASPSGENEGASTISGNGTIKIGRSSGNATLGVVNYTLTAKVSGNTIKPKKEKYYPIVSISARRFGKYYKTNKKLKLYKTASKKKAKATLKTGTRFRAIGVKRVSNGFWVYIKTKTQKKGWLYFPNGRSVPSAGYLIGSVRSD